jgi:Tfp pilus assembly PilM family ATPase
MKWPFRKHNHYALTGDTRGSLLAQLTSDKQGQTVLNIVSSTSGLPINNETNLNRLLSSVPQNLQGKVAVSLPLHFFETITLTLPAMPVEAVGQALPYHLAKAVRLPLREYLYDWQITSRTQEKIQLTVYLFPAQTFNLMRRELSRKQLEITYLDCDIFAAFAFLAARERLTTSNATLCLLLWPDSVSIGIYENKIITLARSFSLDLPQEDFTLSPEKTEEPPAEETFDLEMKSDDTDTINNFSDHGDNSILLDFDILNHPTGGNTASEELSKEHKNNGQLPPVNDLPAQESPAASGWQDYLERVNLEVMRTRDYYISVVKGAPIHHAFLGGADQCFDALKKMTESSLGIEFLPLTEEGENIEGCRPIYSAICKGAGTRW